MFDEFKNFGKIVKNSCGLIMSNGGSFLVFEKG
jgi:hypothetical protein